jgi:hypothetical protein
MEVSRFSFYTLGHVGLSLSPETSGRVCAVGHSRRHRRRRRRLCIPVASLEKEVVVTDQVVTAVQGDKANTAAKGNAMKVVSTQGKG